MEGRFTLVVIKPDAMRRGLAGIVLSAFESKGFQIRACKTGSMTPVQAQALYRTHAGKPFYEALVDFMCDGTYMAFILEREYAVFTARQVVNRLRLQWATSTRANVVHASDSDEVVDDECGALNLKSWLDGLRALEGLV